MIHSITKSTSKKVKTGFWIAPAQVIPNNMFLSDALSHLTCQATAFTAPVNIFTLVTPYLCIFVLSTLTAT